MLVVPPARGAGDLAPALRRLRGSLPGATVVLLAGAPDGAPADPTLADEVLPARALARLDPAGLPALVDRLAAARVDAALVLTAEGESAFEMAYLAYLAGIPLRAGLAAEFGGGVLSPWVRPPAHGTPAVRRHLFLLGELGL